MSIKFHLLIISILLIVSVNFAQTKEDSSAAEMPKGLTGKKVIENYINALGGRNNLNKVKDRTTVMKGDIKGKKITMTIYQKAPDKMKQEIIDGPIKQFIYFNGQKGTMKVEDKTLDVKGSELENLKYGAMMDLLTNLDSLGIKLKLDGMDKINGKETYKVDMIFPSGVMWAQYFDPHTWLKVKESEEIKVPRGTFIQNTYLSDYRIIDGVKYPFAVKQTIGEQQLDFKVISIKINTGLSDSLFVVN